VNTTAKQLSQIEAHLELTAQTIFYCWVV